jgi:hypothetical protein
MEITMPKYTAAYPDNHGKTWTRTDLWLLAELGQNRRKSWVQIARKLKRTETACIAKFNIIRTAFLMFDPRYMKAESIMDIILRDKD